MRATRCVVPADAFYEWDRTASPRQPYAIGPADAGDLLPMAGIWSATRHAPPTVAILTTAPNELVGRLPDRMPVILELAPMLLAAPEARLRMWPVSTAVNRVQVDGPELLRRIELAPTLGLA